MRFMMLMIPKGYENAAPGTSPDAQARRILGFVDHWNRVERHPFRWTWRTDRLQNRRAAA